MTFLGRARVVAVLTLVAVLSTAACSTNPATGEQNFTAFMSPEREKQIGAEEHPKIVTQFGGVYDEGAVAAYVGELGGKMLQASELAGEPFTFTVLDSDVVNAFALPGGYVYVSRGLIALAENEAELAGVIGHEIGHVVARHSAQRYSQAMAANIGLSIIGIIGQVAGVPSQANDLLSVGATAVLQGYSREQELEADMLGVRYLSRTGYDPAAMRTFFEKMAGNDELRAKLTGQPTGEEAYNFASSHPRNSDRIQQAIDLSSTVQVASPVVNRDRFLAEIDGMIFGDSPAQGIRRGRTFSHPDLRLTFTVPPDYYINNQPDAVISVHPNGSQIIFDADTGDHPDLRKYLTDDWGRNLNLADVERINVNGFDAWTGRANLRTRSGQRVVRLIAMRDDGVRIFRFAFIIPPDAFEAQREELQRTTYSFRRLTDAEIAGLTPLRIRTRTATAGETAADLERAMAVEQYPEDWFRLINQNALLDGVTAGERFKIVAD